MIWSEKNLGPKKKFESKNIFGPKKVLGSKIISSTNFFLSLFLVGLVTWVFWTPIPLNSAKSPWEVNVSNFRLLIRPLLIDFGGGSSSCCSCCCCDRGKTKSTPSPKTEVWTWDWSLTIRRQDLGLQRQTSIRLKIVVKSIWALFEPKNWRFKIFSGHLNFSWGTKEIFCTQILLYQNCFRLKTHFIFIFFWPESIGS